MHTHEIQINVLCNKKNAYKINVKNVKHTCVQVNTFFYFKTTENRLILIVSTNFFQAVASAAPDSPDLDIPGHHRKGSILRAASALAGGIEEVEDITFTPIKQWTEQPTSEDLIQRRVGTRGRFGWEVDFDDFQMPLLKNVYERVEVFGGIDND